MSTLNQLQPMQTSGYINCPSSVEPKRTSVHDLSISAVERLAGLVQQTDNLAYFLRGPVGVNGAQAQSKPTGDPTMLDKLHGVHQLINILENNLRDIDQAVR